MKSLNMVTEVLNKTPEMLPVLKQAGVVDSGGQGLMQVVKGAYDAFLGKEIDLTIEGATKPIDKSKVEVTDNFVLNMVTARFITI